MIAKLNVLALMRISLNSLTVFSSIPKVFSLNSKISRSGKYVKPIAYKVCLPSIGDETIVEQNRAFHARRPNRDSSSPSSRMPSRDPPENYFCLALGLRTEFEMHGYSSNPH